MAKGAPNGEKYPFNFFVRQTDTIPAGLFSPTAKNGAELQNEYWYAASRTWPLADDALRAILAKYVRQRNMSPPNYSPGTDGTARGFLRILKGKPV